MKRFTLLAMLLLAFSACSTEESQEISTGPEMNQNTPLNPPPENPIGATFQRICVEGEEQNGPWNNSLTLSWLDEEWEKTSQTTLVEGGGVPNIIQDAEGRLIMTFQWFPCDNEEAFDQVAVMISEDEGATWSDPELIEIDGLPESYQRPFDPTLALLPDGRIRLYYTSNENGLTSFNGDTNIFSAISEDGIHYTFEEGERFGLENEAAYDSAVGYWDGLWHIITPQNTDGSTGEANHATSEDGLVFETQETIALGGEVNWTGNFFAMDEGLYFFGTPGLDGKNWFTFTTDGVEWSAPQPFGKQDGDPAVLCLEDDTCLVVGVAAPKLF